MRVLIADDEVVSRRLLEASLRRWGYDVVTAEDGFEAWRILQSPDAPKLVVLDWLMPGIDGAQICREVRRNKQEPYTYILLLTGKHAKQDVIQGLDAGADDYVTKPFDAHELEVRLRTGKRILCLQEQLINARDALHEMATRDTLTGLWNRAAILDILANELTCVRRRSGTVGVMLVDLDHFKNVNDTRGHLVGDELLRSAAHAMRSSVRLYDAVGRYGGDEFLLVLPGCDRTNAESHAERVREAIGRVVLESSAEQLRVAASLGVTVFDGRVDASASSVAQVADKALYVAKRAGRNRVAWEACSNLVDREASESFSTSA